MLIKDTIYVINQIRFKDKSKIIIGFSKVNGKYPIFIPNAYKSDISYSIHLLNKCNITAYKKNNSTLKEISIDVFNGNIKGLNNQYLALYICAMINKILPEQIAMANVFKSIDKIMDIIKLRDLDKEKSEKIQAYFLKALLYDFGIQTNFDGMSVKMLHSSIEAYTTRSLWQPKFI